jgi:hypothetical protein
MEKTVINKKAIFIKLFKSSVLLITLFIIGIYTQMYLPKQFTHQKQKSSPSPTQETSVLSASNVKIPSLKEIGYSVPVMFNNDAVFNGDIFINGKRFDLDKLNEKSPPMTLTKIVLIGSNSSSQNITSGLTTYGLAYTNSDSAHGLVYANTDLSLQTLDKGTEGFLLQSQGNTKPQWVDPATIKTDKLSFSHITGGVNTAALIIGNGASLSTTGTGNINATQLLGNTWESPGSLGLVNPSAGAFTTFSASGQTSFTGLKKGIAHIDESGVVSSSPINLANDDVSGLLPLSKGGTEASTAASARNNLGLVSGGDGDIWVEKSGDTMIGSLLPNETGTLNIGSVSQYWNNIFANHLNLDSQANYQLENLGGGDINLVSNADSGDYWKFSRLTNQFSFVIDNLTKLSINSSGITTPFVSIGNGVNGDLLTFNSERPWKFTSSGLATSTTLDLQATSDNKSFRIVSSNGTQVPLQVYTSNSATTSAIILGANLTTLNNGNIRIVPNGTGITQIGDAGITSHSFNTNDDLFVSGKLEVDGIGYFDAGLNIRDFQPATVAAQIYNTSPSDDADGLNIKIANTSTATVSSSNHFINFETAGIGNVGSIQGNGSNGIQLSQNGIADYAEYMPKDKSDSIPDGSLLCMRADGFVAGCTNTENSIVGVASGHPFIIAGDNLGDRSIAVGLTGIVETYVSSANGEIKPGDMISVSEISGVGVKAKELGMVVGRALESYSAAESGRIKVLVNPDMYISATNIGSTADLAIPLKSIPPSSSLTDSNNATNAGSLSVLGRTLLSDVGITGKLSMGLLAINGFDNNCCTTMNTSSGPLMLQSQGLNSIDMMNGKITIDQKGNLAIKETVIAKKYEVDTTDKSSSSIGEAVLPARQTRTTIETSAIAEKSAVFLTAEDELTYPLFILEKNQGNSFTVGISQPEPRDIKFNWWVVN